MGTGVNSQLLYTSPSWRFEFYANMMMGVMALPLNYYLVKTYGIIGAAYANVIYGTIYNAIRILFIYKKYNMQPFTAKTIWAVVCAVGVYFIVYFIGSSLSGWTGMAGKSALFSILFVVIVYYLNLTPDFLPIVNSVRAKLKRR